VTGQTESNFKYCSKLVLVVPGKWILKHQLQLFLNYVAQFSKTFGQLATCPLTLSADFGTNGANSCAKMIFKATEPLAVRLQQMLCSSPVYNIIRGGGSTELVFGFKSMMMEAYPATTPHSFYSQNAFSVQGPTRFIIWGYVEKNIKPPVSSSSSSSSSFPSSSSSSTDTSLGMNFVLFQPPVLMPHCEIAKKKAPGKPVGGGAGGGAGVGGALGFF